jgi:hypothetical protein
MAQPDDRQTPPRQSPAGPEDHGETGQPTQILDWDACIESPPPRPSGKVKVRLHFRGRDKPIPVEPPEDDRSKKAS